MKTEAELRDQLVGLCMGDVGQEETNGKNRSPLVDSINKEIGSGATSGAAYCIAGLLIRGVKRLCAINGLKNPVYMTPGTQNFFNHAPQRYHRDVPEKGDIGILVHRNDPGHGHAFMIREHAIGKFLTVEYNTDGAGSREGQGVWAGTRYPAGTGSMRMRGFVDVVQWIIDENISQALGSVSTPSTEKPTSDVLKVGDTGASVQAVQKMLASLGYQLTGTGNFGSKTLAAVKSFQIRAGLTADGEVGPKTYSALVGMHTPATTAVGVGSLPWGAGHPEWNVKLTDLVTKSHLPDLVPVDIAEFNAGYPKASRAGRIKFWVHLISKVTQYESGFKIGSVYHEPAPLNVDSLGLLQLSVHDSANYGIKPPYTREQLLQAEPNLTLGVKIFDTQVAKHGRLGGQVEGKWKGGASYWSTLRSLKQGKARKSYLEIKAYVKALAL